MNKAAVAARVAAQTSLSRADADSAVSGVFSAIADALVGGETVTIAGFGTFLTKSRSARQGRNTRTGESIAIAASTTPSFKASKTPREAVKMNISTRRRNLPDGWQEIIDLIQETGYFRDEELNPEITTRKLVYMVRRFTTIIGYGTDGTPIPTGSGTFVRKADGQCGILTAGHVIGAIRKGQDIFAFPAQYGDAKAWLKIQAADMHAHGETNTTSHGPDIGWISLSAQEANRMESLGAVFHNRARNIEEFTGDICRIGIIFGFVATESNPKNKTVVAHSMLIGKTDNLPNDAAGWDYGEYAITSDDESIPRTHRGVSGSAAWRIDLPVDGQGRKAVKLEGFVYAEGRKDDRKLIAHGEQSVRTILREH